MGLKKLFFLDPYLSIPVKNNDFYDDIDKCGSKKKVFLDPYLSIPVKTMIFTTIDKYGA